MPNIDQYEITVERRFDVTIDITEDWFRSYVRELAKWNGDNEDGFYDVRLGPDFDNRIAFRNVKVWSDYVLEHWKDVVESSISLYQSIVRRAKCHHQRQELLLEINAISNSDIDSAFEPMRKALSLTTSPANPYRYRRSWLEFNIGNWRPDLFVKGIQSIAAPLGPAPEILQAYAKSFEGEVEKLIPFFDLKSFCEGIGVRASRFGEIAIRMQARGIGIGVGVTSDHKKLGIRTSLPPDKADNLIAAWPEQLMLKQVKATDTTADVGSVVPTASETPWLKYGPPIAVAFITAVSTTGIVSLKKAVWPDYKVIIASPPVEKGIARWRGGEVNFIWYLQPDQPSLRSLRKDVVSTVYIHDASGSRSPLESKSPLSRSLEPGTYVVVIDAPGATPAQIQLVVERPLSQPEKSIP